MMWVVKKKNGGEVVDGAGESGNATQERSGQVANTEERGVKMRASAAKQCFRRLQRQQYSCLKASYLFQRP